MEETKSEEWELVDGKSGLDPEAEPRIGLVYAILVQFAQREHVITPLDAGEIS